MEEARIWETFNCKDIEEIIKGNLRTIDEKFAQITASFVTNGYYLRRQHDEKMYEAEGYESFEEYVKAVYGKSRSWAKRMMQINEKFSVGGNDPRIDSKYIEYSVSQLQEMLYLEEEQLEHITPDMTIKEIREVRKPEIQEEPVSILGYPLRVYPEGSLIATPGCGNQDCYSCHRDGCELRQVDCYCVESPMGNNSFPCTILGAVESLRQDVGSCCQFVNEDLAYHRPGDGQPVPCCKECPNPCGYECRRSMQARYEKEEAKKKKLCDVAQTGTCIHRPEFTCTLPEAFKLAVGDGIDCNKKCCWDCQKRNECGYRCNSASGHPMEEEQIPGQMNVEDYPELLPEKKESNINMDNDIDNNDNNLVDEQPEVVMDAEYQEVTEEPFCQEAADLDELTFSQTAIRDYLEEEEHTLAEYEKVNSEDGGLPHNLMMRQMMLVKALRLLKAHEMDAIDQDNDDEQEEYEELEPVQPELPVLKNNDQRKEWLNNYKEWGLWYRDEHIDVNYYKYDFSDGSRLVVAEYPQRRMYWKANEFRNEHYYHMIEKNKKFYGNNKIFEGQYMHNADCETGLVEFLKNLQKGEKK